jgi:hypothetical protein
VGKSREHRAKGIVNCEMLTFYWCTGALVLWCSGDFLIWQGELSEK